jgi:hypothetical protein
MTPGRRLPGDPAFAYREQAARDNGRWPDHVARTHTTAGLIAATDARTVVDPACGDGSIVLSAARMRRFTRVTFCDVNRANCARVARAIAGGAFGGRDPDWSEVLTAQDLAKTIAETEGDLVVLTEILEHLAEPGQVLELARARGFRMVVASSPVAEPLSGPWGGAEHLWSFRLAEYTRLLRAAGWKPKHRLVLSTAGAYSFQIVLAEARP